MIEGLLFVLQWETILFIFLGAFFGIVLGALPGLTAGIGIALIVSFTWGLNPVHAFALYIGTFSGGVYAGSIAGILFGIPGTPSSAATTVAGYPLIKKGRAGEALTIDIVSSFLGGCFGAIVLLFMAPLIARLAAAFGPAEFFALALLGLTAVATLTRGHVSKGLVSGLLGMTLAMVGTDPFLGYSRFSFRILWLYGGFHIIVALLAMFAIPQIFELAREGSPNLGGSVLQKGLKLEPKKVFKYLMASYKGVLLKSSIIGTIVGAVPGAGATVASWIAYNETKRTYPDEDEEGGGNIACIAAAEASNNAAVAGAMIPALTFGIPGSGVTAIILAALLILGIQPGPRLFLQDAHIGYALIFSVLVSNFAFMILAFPICNVLTKVTGVPMPLIVPTIAVLTFVGMYASCYSIEQVILAIFLGFLFYILKYYGYSSPAMMLGYILGPIAEANFNRALWMYNGSYLAFVTRPISLILILVSLFMLLQSSPLALKGPWKKRSISSS